MIKKERRKEVIFTFICILIFIIFCLFTFIKLKAKNLQSKDPEYDYHHMYDNYHSKYNYETLDTLKIYETFSYLPTLNNMMNIYYRYNVSINFITCEISYTPEERTSSEEKTPVFKGTFSKEECKKILLILKKYDTLSWKPGTYYNDKSHGLEPSAYLMNPDAEYRKLGKYFQISSGPNQYYIGMSQEKKFKRENEYDCSIKFGTDSEYLKYTSYGLPKGYNECMEEIWDFVFNHVDAEDYRKNLDKKVSEEKKKEESQTGEPNLDELAYFSFEEFFGGFNSGIKASLKFDEGFRDTKCLDGDYKPYKEVYSIDVNGFSHLLGNPDEKIIQKINDIIPSGQYRDTDNATNEKLIDILKKYNILDWKDKSYYEAQSEPDYVIQGDFFNIKPGISGEENHLDEKEYEIRSSYNGFINLYDTEGRRISLQYDNHGIPEDYQAFRQELWDFAIDYMSEGDISRKQEEDWRNYIDKAGRTYLEMEDNKN